MQLILNIGLKSNGRQYDAGLAVDALRGTGLASILNRYTLVQSDTEPTLVVTCEFTPTNSAGNAIPAQAAYQVAAALNQDCIAVYSPHVAFGALIGPRAALWGAFNPEFFIMPDGTRLSQPAVKVAA